MLDLIIENFRAPTIIDLESLKIMRLSFYSGLAIAVMAADTAKAIKLEDDDEANYLAEIKDSEPQSKGWNLSQSMSEGEGSLSTGAESEADNNSEAWATASSGSEGESESGGESGSDVDSKSEGDSDVDSEGESDVDSEGDSDVDSEGSDDLAQIGSDEFNLAQVGSMTEADAEFFSWIKKKALAAKKLAMRKAAQAKKWLMARLHRQR